MSIKMPKNILFWCQTCNLPILRSSTCGSCENETRVVKCTPPYELRPGFSFEIDYLRKCCNENFGDGTGEILFPKEGIVLMNDVPGIDRFEEIIVDGECVAALRYEIGKGYKFLLKIEGAKRISDILTRNYVVVEDDAAPFILKKANTLRPGVVNYDPNLRKGLDAVVMDAQRNVLSVGTAMMGGEEAAVAEKGVVVKTRSVVSPIEREEIPGPSGQKPSAPPTWDDVVAANAGLLGRIEDEAVSFVKKMVEQHEKLPVSVSFSGGKDSLATLLLVLKAGLKPEVVFINTELEFPETVDYVREIAERYDLKLLEASAGDGFWEGFRYFGPPGKDYRWCCKTQKLGPVSKLFTSVYPDGVLSFIGQRRFESREREKKGRVFRNPWVPLQLGASPIQNWTSLEVWLYILREQAPVNVWYERGLSRIGCWLCPSSDQGDMEFVQEFYDEGYKKLQEELVRYARNKGFPGEWVNYGLWRWKRPPQFIKGNLELEGAVKRGAPEPSDGEPGKEPWFLLKFQLTGGSMSQDGRQILKGEFSQPFSLERARALLAMVGVVEECGNDGQLKITRGDMEIKLRADGGVVATGPQPKELSKLLESTRKLIIKAHGCLDCGVCISGCPKGALSFQGSLVLDEEACSHCLSCISPCPVVDYRGRD